MAESLSKIVVVALKAFSRLCCEMQYAFMNMSVIPIVIHTCISQSVNQTTNFFNFLPDMPILVSSNLAHIKILCQKYEQMGIQLSD